MKHKGWTVARFICLGLSSALFSIISLEASAQSSPDGKGPEQGIQGRSYWTDPSTGLLWAGKDNGKDVNWRQAVGYCRQLRLAGYVDWLLPTINELEGIYDKGAESTGANPPSHWHGSQKMAYHVKGGLFLTGDEWSNTQRTDDRGRSKGLAWYFDFLNGRPNDDDAGGFTGYYAKAGRRALCVRHP